MSMGLLIWGIRCEAYPCLLEKCLSCSFPCGVTSLSQVFHVNKSSRGKHDSLIQEETCLTIEAISAVDNAEELMEIH